MRDAQSIYHWQLESPRENLAKRFPMVESDLCVWLNERRKCCTTFRAPFRQQILLPKIVVQDSGIISHLNPVRVNTVCSPPSIPRQKDPFPEGRWRECSESSKRIGGSSFRAYLGSRPTTVVALDETLGSLPGRSLRTIRAHYREHIALMIGAGDFAPVEERSLSAELLLGSETSQKGPANHQWAIATSKRTVRRLERMPMSCATINWQ